MIDYEETKEDAMLSFRQQIKQLIEDAFDKGYQCGYRDGYQYGYRDYMNNESEKSCSTYIYPSVSLACAAKDIVIDGLVFSAAIDSRRVNNG